jgi:hypothetical protein
MEIKIIFRSLVVITFQSVFYLEMHQNNIFYFLKITFYIVHQNNLKTLKNINLKKKLIFFQNIFKIQKQIESQYLFLII